MAFSASATSASCAVSRVSATCLASCCCASRSMSGLPLGSRLSGRGREAAHVALGAAPVVFDAEAARLDHALGIAVGMAPPAHPRPGRLQPILEPGLPRLGRAHMLEHAEAPA